MHDHLGDLLARVARAARSRVILSERLDVHAVDLPEGGPLEPPVQLPFLDRRLADVAATFASVRGARALDRCRLRADRLALLAERLEGNPSGGVRMTGPVLVHDRPDLLGPGREVADERLHLRIPIGLGRAHDADVRGEPVEDAAEVLPVMLDPIRVAAEGIGDVDEPSSDILSSVFLRELGDLPLLALPLILGVEDQALDRLPSVLAQAPCQELGERDLPAEPAHMLQAADAQARVDDEVRLRPDVGLRLRQKLIVPMGQRPSPQVRMGRTPKALRGSDRPRPDQGA